MRVRNKRLQSYSVGGNSFKVDLDGYGQRNVLAGKGPDKRREFFYWTDDGDLAGLRYYWRSSWSSPLELAEHEAGAYEEMAHRAFVCLGPAGDCRPAPGNVPGIPAATEA